MVGLGLRMLRHDRLKTGGTLLAVTFAVFLVSQQLGLFRTLSGYMAALVTHSAADVWVADAVTPSFLSGSSLTPARVHQVASVPGVAGAWEVLVVGAEARDSEGATQPVSLVGAEAPEFIGGPFFVDPAVRARLLEPNAVLFDEFDRKRFPRRLEEGDAVELNGIRARVAGFTYGARTFGGNFAFASLDLARTVAGRPTGTSFVLVRAESGVDPSLVADRIERIVPEVRASPSAAFAQRSIRYTVGNTGIGQSVGALVVFAVLVGVLSVGVALFSSVIDRLQEFGTLKAIGARNSALTKLLLGQALAFAVAGFVLGQLGFRLFAIGLRSAGFFISLPVSTLAVLFLGTLVFCSVAALLAIRRVLRLEPGLVMRG
jgi:putative ABC transport system permease protein